MSVARRTREAVRERPFLRDALAAGIVNYAAAAERLELDAGPEAVATALRRYADELAEQSSPESASVRLKRGFTPVKTARAGDGSEPEGDDRPENGLLTIGETSYRSDSGDRAAIVARGDGVVPTALERVLGRLRAEEVSVSAAAVGDGTLVVIVSSRDSASALRVTEAVFER